MTDFIFFLEWKLTNHISLTAGRQFALQINKNDNNNPMFFIVRLRTRDKGSGGVRPPYIKYHKIMYT
jgi:hypothetical protein